MTLGSSSLNIVAWNMHGFHKNSLYFQDLCKKCDIITVSEHWLYPEEHPIFQHTLGSDFSDIFKCSSDLRPGYCGRMVGHAGIALCWKYNSSLLSSKMNHCKDNDRICVMCVHLDNSVVLYIIAVYMPPCNSCLADFDTTLDILEETVMSLGALGHVCIIGDFNAQLGREAGPRATRCTWSIKVNDCTK